MTLNKVDGLKLFSNGGKNEWSGQSVLVIRIETETRHIEFIIIFSYLETFAREKTFSCSFI